MPLDRLEQEVLQSWRLTLTFLYQKNRSLAQFYRNNQLLLYLYVKFQRK